MGVRCTAFGLVVALVPVVADAQAIPPDLDCSRGFEALRQAALSMPGANTGSDGRFDQVAAGEPDVWTVEFAFTAPGQPEHPAITLRTFRKQVTGVWTAQSKGCGYGDQAAFASLMSGMKARDSELTNASRQDVERQKQQQSPLGGTP